MLELLRTVQKKDYYLKLYKTNGYIYKILDQIIYSNIPIVSVRLTENQDVGLKMYNGEYSFDDFIMFYDKAKFDVDNYAFYIQGRNKSISVYTDDDTVILKTDNPQDDLNTILTNIKNVTK